MYTSTQKRATQKKLDDQAMPSLYAIPSVEDYVASTQRRTVGFMLGGGVLAGSVASAYVAFGMDNTLLPIALLLAVITPILLWRFPRFSLFFTLAAACLFELDQLSGPNGTQYADALTDRVPFFWNVNTIFQIYAHTNFKGIPLSLFEFFLIIAAVCSVLRTVYNRTTTLRVGALFLPIGIYLGFVLFGWIGGVVNGGDFKISLQEVRSQFYFGIIYLMAVNIVRERQQVFGLLWVTVCCIGFKAILLTFRRYVTLNGQSLPDQGVGAHEEAFFFNVFILLLMTLVLCKVLPRLQWLMWSLLPFVVLANLACNRRAATAAMVFVFPVILLALYQALPDRRRLIVGLGVVLSLAFSVYYPAFKNSDSVIAQPARAIRSNFQPDARDASSNAARDAENANLMATIKANPIFGYGYGRPYYHVVAMADISKIYALEDFIPHNQILWVWERVGTIGFLIFWMMISAIIIFAAQTLRAPGADNITKAIGLFVLLLIFLLIIFGLLDLQLSNFRDVLFVGLWTGALAVTPGMQPRELLQRQVGGAGR